MNKEIKIKVKGIKGDSPTDEHLVGLIKPLIPEPIKGDEGPSPSDEKLVSLIVPLIPEPKNGKMPTDDRLISLIKPLITLPEVREQMEETPETIVKKINGGSSLIDKAKLDVDWEEYKNRETTVEDVKGLPETIRQIQHRVAGYNQVAGGGTNITLKTNGVGNAIQTELNLKAGTNMTLTSDGNGGVTFDAAGGDLSTYWKTDGSNGPATGDWQFGGNNILSVNNVFSDSLATNTIFSQSDYGSGTVGNVAIGAYTNLIQANWSIEQDGIGRFSQVGFYDSFYPAYATIYLNGNNYFFNSPVAGYANIVANGGNFSADISVATSAYFSSGSAGGQLNWTYNNETDFNGFYVTTIGTPFGWPADGALYINAEEGFNATIGASGFTAYYQNASMFNDAGNIIRGDAGGTYIGNGSLAVDIDSIVTSLNSSTFILPGIPGRRSAPLFIDQSGSVYGGTYITQVGLVTQSAAKAATTLWAVPSGYTGTVRVSFVAKVTRAATTSSTLGGANGFRLSYTDQADSVAVTTGNISNDSGATLAGNTTQIMYSGSFICRPKASTNLQYTFDYTSVGATAMQYSLHITAEPI